jgi:hypothetical protein
VSAAGLASRLMVGAIAGIAATVAMTATMRRLHGNLPAAERYPLPPREITQRLMPVSASDDELRDSSLLAHFGYGAVVGALFAASGTRKGDAVGAVLGAGVWALSYFGWVPGFGVLRPANKHPARRNALMICAHLVWGAVTTWTVRELEAAQDTILRGGPLRDAPAR